MVRQIAIISNHLAGNGRSLSMAAEIAAILQRENISHQIFQDQWPGDWGAFSDIWIVGGDGTLNYFVNKYPNEKRALMIFPGGTGNDFCWALYQGKKVSEMVAIGLVGKSKPIDAGTCNGKLFMNGLGVGFDGAVAHALQGIQKTSVAIYWKTILKLVLRFRESLFKISSENYTAEKKALMINLMNGERAGGSFFVTPGAAFDDGLLQVNLVRPVAPLKRFFFLPLIEKGKHTKLSVVEYFTCYSMCIESEKPFHAHVDGEYMFTSKVEVKTLPLQFNFIF